jgi:hypothetical protein
MRAIAMRLMSFGQMVKVIFPFSDVVQRLGIKQGNCFMRSFKASLTALAGHAGMLP